jgi:hypothetical protein
MAVAGAEVFATRNAAIQSSESNNDGRIKEPNPLPRSARPLDKTTQAQQAGLGLAADLGFAGVPTPAASEDARRQSTPIGPLSPRSTPHA